MSELKYVVKRSGAIVDFTPDRITNAIYRAAVAVGGRDRSIAENLSKQVVKILENSTPGEHIPTIEEIQDVVEKVLIENGHAKVAKAYILYRDERTRHRKERASLASHPSENIPWSKIWHVLDWASSHDLHTIERYNQRLRQGEIKKVIRESEAFYEEDIENAAETIAARKDSIKMVFISGPSSSGKTTTTIKISQRLRRMKMKLVTLNVDNYFFDLKEHPRDEFGDYDFETPQALELSLINAHLHSLIEGNEIQMPHYDFKTGFRSDQTTPLQLKQDEVLLIDSLHGLYPEMTRGIHPSLMFKVYLEPLLQMKDADGRYIRWTDIRLMRRMLRDATFRAYEPQKTLEHWHYVRASELRNIIPNFNNADYIVSSAMPYELSVYRPKLLDSFIKWVTTYENDPLHEDAFERAQRTCMVLQQLRPVEDDNLVPPNSVLREFIGGSNLQYH